MDLRLLKAILILPGTALVYIPILIIWLTRNTAYAASLPTRSLALLALGLLFAVAGFVLMYWTVMLFHTKGGGGTPAPWDPIKKLIIEGPYRYVRNPMLLGVNLFLVAEALMLQSMPILIWLIVFVVLNTVYFILSEEPKLEKRFGKPYVDYKNNVPRRIPRPTPYEIHNSN